MTRQDHAFAFGCAVVSLLALLSFTNKSWTRPAMASTAVAEMAPQNIQSARIHSLAGASAQAVSLF